MDDPLPPAPQAIPLTGASWPTSSATGCPGLRISSIRTFDSSIPKHASMCLGVSSVSEPSRRGSQRREEEEEGHVLFTITK
jgi:hypothetical protein